jgi:hypothetical protein
VCVSLKDNEKKLKLHKYSGAYKENFAGVSGEMEAAGVVTVFEC